MGSLGFGDSLNLGERRGDIVDLIPFLQESFLDVKSASWDARVPIYRSRRLPVSLGEYIPWNLDGPGKEFSGIFIGI